MADIIHREKLFGGRETAQQVHADMAWYGRRCAACGGAPALRVQVFLLLSDMTSEGRMAEEFEVAMGRKHLVRTDHGPAIRASDMVACSLCAPELERAAARAPSYAMVHIDRGPGPDNAVVGVVAELS